MIKRCNNTECISPFQDKRYSNGMRVMNERQGEIKGYRCSVCGKEPTSTTSRKKGKK